MWGANLSLVGVIGAGAMGRGIVQVLLQSGHTVRWIDSRVGATEEGRSSLESVWRRLSEKGRFTPTDVERWMAGLSLVSETSQFAGCECVIEAIIESEAEKRRLYSVLEQIIGPDVILASNTSSISITRLASGLMHPERFAGFHCFNPVPLMPVVEVIEGLRTAPKATETLTELAESIGLTAVRVRDTPGFMVNQIGRAYPIESAHLVSEGVASYQEVDVILKEQAGFKMGPFELMDLTGLDVTQPVTEILFREHFGEPRYRPSVMMSLRRDAGLLGRKVSQGFYSYEAGRLISQSPHSTEVLPNQLLPETVWIAAADSVGYQWLEQLVIKSGVTLEVTPSPSEKALVLLAPLGEDTTAIVSRLGVPASRAVAIDTFMPPTHRRVLMPSLLTKPEAIGQACALLGTGNKPASIIGESMGFIAQRVLALMINTACHLAQQGISDPISIDRATRIALGYPCGPLEWGDKIGADRILTVLQTLSSLSMDPRYRPSAWLRRRVQLGLSLLSEEPRRNLWQS